MTSLECPLCDSMLDGPFALLSHLRDAHGLGHGGTCRRQKTRRYCFCGFSLSEAGMIRHWERHGGLAAHIIEMRLHPPAQLEERTRT